MNKQIETMNGGPVYVDYSQWDRIREQSSEAANKAIDERIENNVRSYGAKGELAISDRIDRLEHEWDMDRIVVANFAISHFVLRLLGGRNQKSFFNLLAMAQLPFLLYHAFRGWAPPTPILRHLGFRTSKEIDAEKYALKTLRGDFKIKEPNQIN
jgi:hypothetical protein